MSKSASELRQHGEIKSVPHCQQSTVPTTCAKTESSGAKTTSGHYELLAKHATVVQKTQAFFTSLKVRRRGN